MKPDRALPWYVFAVFVVLTLLATSYVWQTTHAADRARFDNAVQATRDDISARLDTYINVLTATRGLVASDAVLPRQDLREYIRSHEIQRRYRGIQGIGLSLRMPAELVPMLEADLRKEGHRDYRVWPRDGRAEVHAVVLLEPPDPRNVRALGYDMFTEPVRREAMARARDTGLPAASGPVTLVQELEARKQPGFLIYTPVYTTGATPLTISARRESLVGFVYAPFRADDLLSGVFGSQQRPEIGFEIRDRGALLFRTPNLPREPRFSEPGELAVAGRTWDIQWTSKREGRGMALIFAGGTFAGGMIIATLLLMLLRVQLAARAEAEQTAQRLVESEALLQRANHAKDEFLATLSHELRTPMTAILGWAQMLADERFDDETSRTGIQAIGKSAKVQAQLIDDLLDISRITAGKMRIDPHPMELEPVVRAAVDTVRPAAETKGVKLSSEIESGVFVNGDAHRLQQVVWNLLTNAVKFTPAGGEVFVTMRGEDREAMIEVRDTGHGIDAAFMPHIFERFRQADSSSTRAHMGLGLGLAIVRHLAELHGGTISAESRGLGKGSTFRVRLPMLAGGSAVLSFPSADAVVHPPLRGVRVMVVDDEEEVRKYIATALRASGVEVRCAADARAALDLLDEWPPDVVLSDLAMPEADGFDLLHWIRASAHERVRGIPVVAVSAFAMPEDRDRASEAGFDGFLAKPVEPSRLRTAVATAAGRATPKG